jgi:drug/metabolite transporter (DMT)-like permease
VTQRSPDSIAGSGRGSYLAGILAILAAAACWSTAGLLIKLVDLPPLKIAFYRSLIAGIFLAVIAGRGWNKIGRGSLLVIFTYALVVNLFVVANKWTTAANAILLQSTAPVWVIVFGALLERTRPRRSDLLAVAVALAGLLLVLAERVGATGGRGNLAALVSGVFFGLMMLFMRRQRATPLFHTLALGNFAAALLALPAIWPDLGLSRHDLLILLILGVAQLGLGYFLFAIAIRRLPALEVSLLALLEPVLNPVWVFLAHGERPGPLVLLGGTIVIGVLALHSVATARRNVWATRRPQATRASAPP